MEEPDVRRKLRHDLRGAFHNLRLCVEVLVRESDPAEALPWLEQIEQAAESCARNADSLMSLPDSPAASHDPGQID